MAEIHMASAYLFILFPEREIRASTQTTTDKHRIYPMVLTHAAIFFLAHFNSYSNTFDSRKL